LVRADALEVAESEDFGDDVRVDQIFGPHFR